MIEKNYCRLNCFECPYDDCIEDGLRMEDLYSEILVETLLGNKLGRKRAKGTVMYIKRRQKKGKRKMTDVEKFRSYLNISEKAANTINAYVASASEITRFCDGEITAEKAIAWKNHLLTNGSTTTANLRIAGANAFFNFLKLNIRLKAVKVSATTSAENVISLEQYNKLCDKLYKDGKIKYYFLIKFLGMTGARISEALKFTKKDLRERAATLNTKGKVRTILFPNPLVAEALPYFETQDNELLFPNKDGGKMDVRAVQLFLHTAAKRYGIPREVMHPHSFRHFFAIRFLKNDNDFSLLSNLLGHQSIATTAIYAKLTQDEQRRRLDEAVTEE